MHVLLLLAAFLQEPAPPEPPRNLVLMIADGFGTASRTMARVVGERPLTLDSLLVGSVATGPSTGLVTDSAAAATAFASGVKTYNGAIGVSAQGEPVATLLEAAQERGMATGLVTTSRLTHATPACFAAHVAHRKLEAEIAAQMVSRGVELLAGGGRSFFLPRQAGGKRTDGRDLLAEVRGTGVQVATSLEELASARLPLLALLADSHLDYELDRGDQPDLAALTALALDLLAGDAEGFLLVVEGGRIDHAAHANDPAAHVHDVLAYDAAVAVALAFARQDGRTLLVSVADHETGGMTLGRDGQYVWRPEILRQATASAERLAEGLAGAADWLERLAQAGLAELSDEEASAFAAAALDGDVGELRALVADAYSRRAGIGWTTSGHTGADVELFAAGPGAERLRGHRENDALGRLLAELLGFDLARSTDALRAAEER